MTNGNHSKRPNRGGNPSHYHRRKKGKGRKAFFRHKNRRVREALRGVA